MVINPIVEVYITSIRIPVIEGGARPSPKYRELRKTLAHVDIVVAMCVLCKWYTCFLLDHDGMILENKFTFPGKKNHVPWKKNFTAPGKEI